MSWLYWTAAQPRDADASCTRTHSSMVNRKWEFIDLLRTHFDSISIGGSKILVLIVLTRVLSTFLCCMLWLYKSVIVSLNFLLSPYCGNLFFLLTNDRLTANAINGGKKVIVDLSSSHLFIRSIFLLISLLWPSDQNWIHTRKFCIHNILGFYTLSQRQQCSW